MMIGFYTEGLAFNGDTMYTKALGGSETALSCMARHLAKRGHRVMVFCRCDKPGRYAGVTYYDLAQFGDMRRLYDFDVFVVSRFANALGTVPTAGLRVLWNHDVLIPESKSGIYGASVWADLAFHLSQYHRKQWLEVIPEIEPICKLTTNGVDLDYIDAATRRTTKKDNVFFYSSRPERGLDVLVQHIWPRILERIPDAQLRVCGYEMDAGMQVPDHMKALYADIDARIKATPSITHLGALTKKQLYRNMAEAKLLLYPTAFPEIFAITAAEAQAVGTPIITTDAFALSETVGPRDCLITGNNTDKGYQDAFVGRVFDFLDDPAKYRAAADAGRKHVEDVYQWKDVAARWERLFVDHMSARSLSRERGVARELVRLGDLVAARASVDGDDSDLRLDARIETARQQDSEDPLFPANPEWAKNDARCQIVRQIVEQYGKQNGGLAGKRLLDIGCNNGAIAVMLANAFPDLAVCGVDESAEAVQLADGHATAHLAEGATHPSFEAGTIDDAIDGVRGTEGSFDIVWAGELLEHIEDTTAFLEKLRAVVKPGGCVILSVPYRMKQVLWSGDPDPADPKAHVLAHPAHFHCFDTTDLYDIFETQRDLRLFRPSFQANRAGDAFGNTVVSFLASKAPFGARDLERKRIITRPYATVSACMIVKNAENDLARCIKGNGGNTGLLGVVDELRIHDTGSTDATLDIARKYTDAITQAPFDNFGQARNESIEHATGDWILWIDADEVLLHSGNLRKWTQTALFNGFVVRQNHLMVDVQGTSDRPIRFLRNGKGYRFVGRVHEHCEDVNKSPFDVAISPALELPDVDIAHTGYLCEPIRREKCLRNWPLVLRDLKENPDRQLNKLLYMRDQLNFAHWQIQAAGNRGLTAEAVNLCKEAVRVYREHFADGKSIYAELAVGMYHGALAHLGRAGVPAYEGAPAPPFELECGIGAGYGGMQAEITNTRRWFADKQEAMAYLAKQAVSLERGLVG